MMALEEILFIYRARMRERALLLQELLAVVGIAVGVALLFASQVASTSLDGSVRAIARQVVGSTQFQLDSRGNEGFDAQLVDTVEHLPGVTTALPLVDQQATITGPSGSASVDLLGADPRFARAGGELLRRFSASQLEHQQALAVPAPLAASIGGGPLQVVKLQVGAQVTKTVIGTTLGEADIGSLIDSQVVLTPISYAQKLAAMPGRINRVFVRARAGHTQQARSALAALAARERLNLVPADFDAQLFSVASAPAQQAGGLFSALSAFVGFLFAFNAMLLTVPERRKLIEALRRRGTTRAMTVQLLSFDALVVGGLGCVLGLALGELLSAQVFHAQPGYLAFAFPIGAQRIVTWQAVALSIGAGLAAAFVGVLAPVRAILARPLRSSVAVERPMRGWTSLRIAVGLACLIVTTVILISHPRTALARNYTVIIVSLCVALMFLLPSLYRGIVTALSWVERRLGVSSLRLALIELDDPLTRVRSLAVAATGAIAVFGSVAMQGAERNLQTGLNHTANEWNRSANLWISPAGTANTLGTTPFPSAVAGKLARLASVQSVRVYRGGFLTLGDRRLWIIAPPRSLPTDLMPSGQLLTGTLATVNARLRGHGWAVISEAIANELHLHIGSSFTLPSPIPSRFRVAGLSTNSGWPPGAVVINADDYARAWGSTAASALQVSVRPGFSPVQSRREVQQAFGPRSGLLVQTAGQRERQWTSISRQGLARLIEIASLVLVAAVLAMAGVMTSMILQRRDQLAYIKRQGFTKGLLWRAVFTQSAILLGAGCSIGALFGIYGQLVISHALATVTGFPIVIGTRATIAFGSFGAVAVAALAIVAIPGYFAVRVRASTVRPA